MDKKSPHAMLFDPSRFPSVWSKLKSSFPKPTRAVHIIGTNGKGTSGRFLAKLLQADGLRVGHYSSPHILKFNERIWLDGEDIDDRTLQECHERLYAMLERQMRDSLSYFEYTTLLAWLIFSERCDIAVMEAGLGGEWDATGVFDYELLLVTPIDYDHRDILGNTIDKIAATKLRAMRSDTLLGLQRFKTTQTIARKISKKRGFALWSIDDFATKQELWKLELFATKTGWPRYLCDNLKLAFAAAKKLGVLPNTTALEGFWPQGRCERLAPNVTLDVGHNPSAALALVKHFAPKKLHLVYNTLADKEWMEVLKILKAITSTVEIIPIDNPRALLKSQLTDFLDKIGVTHTDFSSIKKERDYLVTGSFSVVEAFKRGMNES